MSQQPPDLLGEDTAAAPQQQQQDESSLSSTTAARSRKTTRSTVSNLLSSSGSSKKQNAKSVKRDELFQQERAEEEQRRQLAVAEHLQQQIFCAEHTGDPVVCFCTDCNVPLCAVCVAAHSTHRHMTLSALTFQPSRELDQKQALTDQRLSLLLRYKDTMPERKQKLSHYIEEEIEAILGQIENKRKELHLDVSTRAKRMRSFLESEVALCEAEMQGVRQIEHVLDCIDGGVEAATASPTDSPVSPLVTGGHQAFPQRGGGGVASSSTTSVPADSLALAASFCSNLDDVNQHGGEKGSPSDAQGLLLPQRRNPSSPSRTEHHHHNVILAPDAHELLTGRLQYSEFFRNHDPVVHEAPTMLHQLRLRLPIQNLQEVCDLLDWTEFSMQNKSHLFPLGE